MVLGENWTYFFLDKTTKGLWNNLTVNYGVQVQHCSDLNKSFNEELTLKVLSKIEATDILFFSLLFFRENKTWYFMWTVS